MIVHNKLRRFSVYGKRISEYFTFCVELSIVVTRNIMASSHIYMPERAASHAVLSESLISPWKTGHTVYNSLGICAPRNAASFKRQMPRALSYSKELCSRLW